MIPRVESGVPSRKMPVKKPVVTRAQERRIGEDGIRSVERERVERKTVSGRTKPLATW